MTIMDRIDALGAEIMAAVEEEALHDLALLVAEQSAGQAGRMMVDVIARLAGDYRQQRERDRLRAILDAARLPDVDLPMAPARGPMRRVAEYGSTAGGMRVETGAHWRRIDQLTAMCRQAWLRHERECARTSVSEPFVAPFTPAQIAMGLRYQALVERHDAAGMKCASVEVRAAAVAGRGDGGGFIEAFISEGNEIARIQSHIGNDVALPVQRPGRRRAITDRALVDAVCLAGRDLTTVLRDHGWAKDARLRAHLRGALAAALNRMLGYR